MQNRVIISKINDSVYTDYKLDEKIPLKVFETNSLQSSVSLLTIGIFTVSLIIISIFVGILVTWIIKVRKFRELRHRLIPLYSFDPNEEESWETDFLNVDQLSSSKTQDYQSVYFQNENVFTS